MHKPGVLVLKDLCISLKTHEESHRPRRPFLTNRIRRPYFLGHRRSH
jgi:hypothetical protein